MTLQAADIRELSFQNVVDQILKPNNVKVGGFPDSIFLDLTETEKESLICNICFLIVNDAHQCTNEHLFCRTCVFAWSMTYGENSQKCPMCRVDQAEYAEKRAVNTLLQSKRVACPEDKCTFKAPLKVFMMHGHGKTKYSNSHVDFESIRPPPRPSGARLLVLPSISVTGNTPFERASSIRGQLHQGRMMIHQMMLLLQLEMQLRQQALTGFQEATDPHTRIQRLDEVMALNEQLNEVGTVLSTLLNSPINNIISANRAMQDINDRNGHDASFQSMLSASGRPNSPPIDDDDDTESDDSSDSSGGVNSALRMGIRLDSRVNRHNIVATNRNTRNNTLSGNTSSLLASRASGRDVNTATNLTSNVSNSVLLGPNRNHANENESEVIPRIEEGRHLSNYSQASMPSVLTDVHPRVLIGGSSSSISQVPNRSSSITRPTVNNSNLNEAISTTNLSERTTRIANTSSNRSPGVPTSVNSRNQTLPNLPGVANNASTSSSTIVRNLPRPPSVPPFINTGSDTPRPPSSQPSEANLLDEERPIVPRGSSAYNRTRQLIENSSRSEVNHSSTTSLSGATNQRVANGNTSISWSSGQNAGTTPRPNSVARQISQDNAPAASRTGNGVISNTLNQARNTNTANNSPGLSNSRSDNNTLSTVNTPRLNEMGSSLTSRTSTYRVSEPVPDLGNVANPSGRQDRAGSGVRRRLSQSHELNSVNTTTLNNRSSNVVNGVTRSITTNRRSSLNNNNPEVGGNSTTISTRTRNNSLTRSRMIDARLPSNNNNRANNARNNSTSGNNNTPTSILTSNQLTVTGQTGTNNNGGGVGNISSTRPGASQATRPSNNGANIANRRTSHDVSNPRNNEPLLRARRRSDIRQNLLRE